MTHLKRTHFLDQLNVSLLFIAIPKTGTVLCKFIFPEGGANFRFETESHYVVQVGLHLRILWPLPPECLAMPGSM